MAIAPGRTALTRMLSSGGIDIVNNDARPFRTAAHCNRPPNIATATGDQHCTAPKSLASPHHGLVRARRRVTGGRWTRAGSSAPVPAGAA
jgi:hypothetical protein